MHACRCPSSASQPTRHHNTAPCRRCRERALSVETGSFCGYPGVEGTTQPYPPTYTAHSPSVLTLLRMAAPAVPGPVLFESGDSESRSVYADANDPIVATLPFAEWEPAPSGAAATPTPQTSLPHSPAFSFPALKLGRRRQIRLPRHMQYPFRRLPPRLLLHLPLLRPPTPRLRPPSSHS